MTNFFTDNEIRALKVIFADCLDGMGGSNWEELEGDPYTWTDPSVLVKNGWTKNEAGGTFAALIVKRAITLMDKNEWALELTPEVKIAVTN
jgi:hypothetical protein